MLVIAINCSLFETFSERMQIYLCSLTTVARIMFFKNEQLYINSSFSDNIDETIKTREMDSDETLLLTFKSNLSKTVSQNDDSIKVRSKI